MFRDFAHVWTPAILASAVRQKPVRTVIAGEPIVFFRDQDGRAGALSDRCPHRGVSLSLGRVGADGCIECPFHGWRFDTKGHARHIPLNPTAKLEKFHATAFPVRQIGELLWMFTAPSENPPEPVVPDGLHVTGLARSYVERTWDCHWTRVMENMLDSPHVPFVHGRSMGKALRRRMTPASTMEIAWEETEWGGRARAIMDGDPRAALLEFYRPNVMALHIPIPGKHFRIHALVVPEAHGRTKLIIVGSRDFAMARILNPWFARMSARIAEEDKAILESSGPDPVPAPGIEPSVGSDRATLQFRKYYHQDLRTSLA